jgi:hypothetical protein
MRITRTGHLRFDHGTGFLFVFVCWYEVLEFDSDTELIMMYLILGYLVSPFSIPATLCRTFSFDSRLQFTIDSVLRTLLGIG